MDYNPPCFIMEITRNGVVHNLKFSPFKYRINNVTFYFSSYSHLKKYRERLKTNRETIIYSLYRRFKIKIYNNILCDIVLYSKLETRGFLLEYKGVFYECLGEVILNGENQIEKK